jgi:maltooligosyltrehalose trehalohydrolase
MHTYGTPADLQYFVDTAHLLGLGVILDVVYNHLGPAGNVMPRYGSHYVSRKYENEWGDPLNFDGPHSQPVRELVLSNVAYWITEFHVDGFRLDAAQQIHDASDEHLLAAVARAARAVAAPRDVVVLAEHDA